MKIKALKNEEQIKTEFEATDNIKEKYELLYNYLYDYLSNELVTNNHCDFIDDRCIANRAGVTVHPNYGCCYIKGIGRCPNLIDKDCACESISCKFYICSYLRFKGIKYKPNKIKIINELLNHKQKQILKKSLFKSKAEVIELLIKYD